MSTLLGLGLEESWQNCQDCPGSTERPERLERMVIAAHGAPTE